MKRKGGGYCGGILTRDSELESLRAELDTVKAELAETRQWLGALLDHFTGNRPYPPGFGVHPFDHDCYPLPNSKVDKPEKAG